MKDLSYRPEIDGLRAIAVVSVLVFHANPNYLGGGYIGVDVFFVISGYLITSILIRDLESGQFSLLRFYVRRARRIVPALVLVLSATLIAAPALLPLSEAMEVAESAAATALFLANFRFWRKSDYFATESEELPLLHMWSLAVEEQYYLFFPIFLFLLFAFGRRAPLRGIVLLALASLCIAEIGWRADPIANFFLPFGRLWELLAGSALACHLRGAMPASRTWNQPLAAAGLAAIIGSVALMDRDVPTPSAFTAIPVAGTVLIIACATPQTLVGRLLALRPMVGVGLISYSVYLWHQPILAFARVNLHPDLKTPLVLLLAALLSLPLGYLSWRFVETPFRRGFSPSRILLWSGATLSGVASLGIGVHVLQEPIRDLYLRSLDESARANYALIQQSQEGEVALDGRCHARFDYANQAFEAHYDRCLEAHGPGILVIGGSHAADLHGALVSGTAHPFILAISRGYCRPHRRLQGTPPHACHYESILKFLQRRGDDVAHVIYTQPFFTLFERYRDTRSVDGFHPELVAEAASYLDQVSRLAPTTMIGPRRTVGTSPDRLTPRHDLMQQITWYYSEGIATAEELADNTFGSELASTAVNYVSLIRLLGQEMPADAIADGKLIFRDGDHWNAHGEFTIGRLLVRALAEKQDHPAAARLGAALGIQTGEER